MSGDLSTKILREIRDGIHETNARLDQTNARLDQTNERMEQGFDSLCDLPAFCFCVRREHPASCVLA